MRQYSNRREFLKNASLGAGSFIFLTDSNEINRKTRNGKRENAQLSILDPYSTTEKMNIVCIGAHPGDPEFGCGGTMAKYAEAGHNVTFLYLTRGEAGDPTRSYAESASLRTKEAQTACKALNVTPQFVGQTDGNTILNNEKNADLLKILQSLKPDNVYTHWPIDAHMDHQIAGLLALTSWVKMNKSFDLYFYEVNTGSETMAFDPDSYVDITKQQEKKKIAMFAHKTQDPVNVYNTFFKQMEAFRGLEANVTAAEAFVLFRKKGDAAVF